MTIDPKHCECGCGRAAPIATKTQTRFGWIKGQPMRFVRGHANRRNIPDYVVDENGCWIWNRGISKSTGYGQTGDGPNANRVMYERIVGPVPKGKEIDHLCRNRACVNPAHLEPVTHLENVRRGRGGQHPAYTLRKLTPEQVIELRASSLPASVFAKQFGVSKSTIHLARNGRQYKELSNDR